MQHYSQLYPMYSTLMLSTLSVSPPHSYEDNLMFVFMILVSHHHQIAHDLSVIHLSAGRACVPQQRSSNVHGGLLRVSPGRAGACAYWSATDQKGNGKDKTESPGDVWLNFLMFYITVKSRSDPYWTFNPWKREGDCYYCICIVIILF